jgi:hypothetical protein
MLQDAHIYICDKCGVVWLSTYDECLYDCPDCNPKAQITCSHFAYYGKHAVDTSFPKIKLAERHKPATTLEEAVEKTKKLKGGSDVT